MSRMAEKPETRWGWGMWAESRRGDAGVKTEVLFSHFQTPLRQHMGAFPTIKPQTDGPRTTNTHIRFLPNCGLKMMSSNQSRILHIYTPLLQPGLFHDCRSSTQQPACVVGWDLLGCWSHFCKRAAECEFYQMKRMWWKTKTSKSRPETEMKAVDFDYVPFKNTASMKVTAPLFCTSS